MPALPSILYIVLTINIARGDLTDFLKDDFIEYINKNQSLWIAGRNFHEDIPLTYFKYLTGTLADNSTDDDFDPPPKIDIDIILPDNFDARVRWPNCQILWDIRDQGPCGSCWAVAAVAALSDRICIASNGSENFYFSASDVLSCCMNCGTGCNGGLLTKGLGYCKRKGIVSGGKYQSHEGCKPYEFAPCDHRYANDLKPCGHTQLTPGCQSSCEKTYKQSYEADKKMCKKIYLLKDVTAAVSDIFVSGPVTASFDVYADFLSYKSGVYRHVPAPDDYIGGHSVKLIGWGVENGVKYWLASNTWNVDWGDKGFFKIVRGENHCNIEKSIAAGKI